MNDDIVLVEKDINLQELIDEYFMKYRFGRFPVVEDLRSERFIGIISLHDIKSIERQRWPEVKVGDIVKTVTEKEKVNMSMEISDT